MAALYIIIAIALAAYYIYVQLSNIYSYWEKKGVKGPKPLPFFGNLKPFWNKEESIGSYVEKVCNEFPKEKVIGIYLGLTPTLIVKDPELVKQVLVKDFSCFTDRGLKLTNEPLQRHLFAVDGDDWKTLRQKLTPLFTTGKLRHMMPILNSCVKRYMDYLDKVVEHKVPHEVRALNMKYTLKTITSVAFGIEMDTFAERKTSFEVMATRIFTPTGFRKFAFLLNNVWPGILTKMNVKVTDNEVENFFIKLVKDIVKEREGKPKVRKDFMDLMIELKEQGTVTRMKDEGMTELEINDALITAQAFVFYAAGFETSSGAMSFLLYELAKNPDVQERCFNEIDEVMKKYNGQLDYDALKQLPYLTMALDESLRKYPIVSALFRLSASDYRFDDLNLTINKGTKLIIPVNALHHDPNHFLNPKAFVPERFSSENKDSIHDVYVPFGEGPRNCIGLRFAKVQSRLGMAHFLHKFKVTPCEKTPEEITFDPTQITLTSKDGIYLNIERRIRK